MIEPKLHQRGVINYLIGECQNQHGMLIAHKMGGGKTLTALMFINNFPNHHHVIVAPRHLRSVWHSDSVKLLKKPINPSKTSVITYEELFNRIIDDAKYLSNKILILDEAHYFEMLIQQKVAWSEAEQIYENVRNEPHKTLVLTGTPIRRGLYDIGNLVNLAAGKNVLPVNMRPFNAKFVIFNKDTVLLLGYIHPILTKTPSILFGLKNGLVKLFTSFASLFLLKYALAKVNVDISFDKLEYPRIQRILYFLKVMNLKVDALSNYSPTNLITNYVGNKFKLKGDDLYALELVVKLVFLTGIFGFVMKLIYDEDALHDKTYDYSTLGKLIKPYVSFYNLTSGKDGVPKVKKDVSEFVMYSDNQFNLWTRLIYNNLTIEDTKKFGKLKKVASDTVDNDNDKDDDDEEVKEPLFVTPFFYGQFGRIVSNIEFDNMYPEKFKIMFRNISKHMSKPKNNHRYVIHSEFEATIKYLKKFLTEKQREIPFTFSHIRTRFSTSKIQSILDDFDKGKINILILDPTFVEGISILKAAQLHILDPPTEYYKYAQLRGRVMRIESHLGLPPHQQTIQYFNYIGILPKDAFYEFNTMDKIRNSLKIISKTVKFDVSKYLTFFNSWIKTEAYKERIFLSYEPTITETVTPECIAFKNIRNQQDESEKLDQIFHSLNVENENGGSLKCCPRYLSTKADSECMRINKVKGCL